MMMTDTTTTTGLGVGAGVRARARKREGAAGMDGFARTWCTVAAPVIGTQDHSRDILQQVTTLHYTCV